MKGQRKRLLVDDEVQRAILAQALRHWATLFVVMLIFLFSWHALFSLAAPPGSPSVASTVWQGSGPAFLALLVIMPVALYDTIRLSNRFAGPMLRLRRALHALARGEEVAQVSFREGDFWQDLAGDFNVVADRLKTTQRSASTAQPRPVEEHEASTEALVTTGNKMYA